jgi:putative acetyltransferase
LIVRPYAAPDLPRLMEIYRDSIHALANPYYTAEQLEAWAPAVQIATRWEQRLAGLQTLVADREGVLAGFVSYELNGHLDLLFTRPEFARRGVATRLCDHAEAALAAAGVSRCFTEASLAARAFFERRGFQVDAEEDVECRGARLRRFLMHKRLVPSLPSPR